jgi:hypothetical protein
LRHVLTPRRYRWDDAAKRLHGAPAQCHDVPTLRRGEDVLYLDGLLGLITLGLWIFCLVDVVTTDESVCRNLPKTVWLLVVLFLPLIGSLVWLVAGRPQAAPSMPYKGNHGPALPLRNMSARPTASSPDDDEAYLRSLRARAEEQRQIYREQRRRELDEG